MLDVDNVTPAIRLMAGQVKNPENYPLFSIRDRSWHPRSYFDTNTRGCIIPPDVVEIDNFTMTPALLQTWRDCQTLERAFYDYLVSINPHSQWFRPCSTVWEFMNAIHIEARQALKNKTQDIQRTHKVMSPDMLMPHFKAYQDFLLEHTKQPIEKREANWFTTHFTIDQFTFPLIYIEGTIDAQA